MASVEEFVQSKIKANKVVVFSATYCPYCTKAKNIFKNYNLSSYEVVELNIRPDFNQAVAYLAKITDGSDTIPSVFVNGKFIGGGNDTEALLKSGELKKLLTTCHAITG